MLAGVVHEFRICSSLMIVLFSGTLYVGSQVDVVRHILSAYEAALGQKINLNKSIVVFSKNITPEARSNVIQQQRNMKNTSAFQRWWVDQRKRFLLVFRSACGQELRAGKKSSYLRLERCVNKGGCSSMPYIRHKRLQIT